MALEIFSQIFVFIIKWLGMVLTGIYDFLTAVLPKFFVFAWEIIQRLLGYVAQSYLEIKAKIKWYSTKKPKLEKLHRKLKKNKIRKKLRLN